MAQLLILKLNRALGKRGDIVEIRASGTPFTGQEPNDFVLVDIFDATIKDFKNFHTQWKREITFEVVASDLSVDSFRLKLSANKNVSGTVGKITKEEAESFILSWNGVVFSWGDNEVVFDINIIDALKSKAFWEISINGVVFTELSYVQPAGVHTIEADYSAISNNPTYVENYIEQKGGVIIAHTDTRLITFTVDRATVRNVFEKDINKNLEKPNAKFRYYIESPVVSLIESNNGRMSVSKAIAINYIKDKLDG